jgi:hypothetical protein
MKWGVESTEPALLAGLWVLLSMMRVLEHEDLNSLLRIAQSVLPTSCHDEIRREGKAAQEDTQRFGAF